MKTSLDIEVGILCAQMEKMEQKIFEKETERKDFEPEVSLIIFPLPYVERDKVKDVLHIGLGCDTACCPVKVERLQMCGGRAGIVKLEMKSVQEKVKCCGEYQSLEEMTTLIKSTCH